MKVPYSPLLSLEESHVASYKIYVLKHPETKEVFYVGQTVQDLDTRLTGHLGSSESNKQKVEFLKGLVALGLKPVIQEIETIHATCYIDKYLVNERELYWIRYYKSIGCKLLNAAGISPYAKSTEYHDYLSSIRKGETQWRYYYCGRTISGIEVYDEKKLNADGFQFPDSIKIENNYTPLFGKPKYNPWDNPRFLKNIERGYGSGEWYDETVYKDLDPNYYDDDY